MRPRFSLRLFLIAFTLLAILFGGATNFVYRINDQVRRHKAAMAQLKLDGVQIYGIGAAPKSKSLICSAARRWIDPDAFPDADSVGFFFHKSIHPQRLDEHLDKLQGDLCVGHISIHVDRLTIQTAQRLAALDRLSSLALTYDSFERGAIENLQNLATLESLFLEGPGLGDLLSNARFQKTLSSITIFAEHTSPQEAAELHKLTNLSQVKLNGYFRGAAMIEGLSACPKLTSIECFSTNFDEAASNACSQLRNVESIEVYISNEDSANIYSAMARLPNLKSAKLTLYDEARMDRSAWAALSKAPALSRLELSGVNLIDRSLMEFDSHPSLKMLMIHNRSPDEPRNEFLLNNPQVTIVEYGTFCWGNRITPDRSFRCVDGKIVESVPPPYDKL